MTRTYALCALTGYVVAWVVYALTKVGDIPQPGTEPYSWWLPINFAMLLILPALLGYVIGSAEGKTGDRQ